MLQFKNETPFAGTILLLPDPDGVDSLYTVIKATFAINGAVAVASEQVPITLAAEHLGEPDASSILRPSDVSLMKPGTDVLLMGHAYAPGGRPTTSMDVSLSVGHLQKTVRVIGDRQWHERVGFSMTSPQPFDAMPLVWERAFGGTIKIADEVTAEDRNPIGAGFWVDGGDAPLEGLPLPNLEDPAELISSWDDRPTPACFAPLAAHWQPRRSFAGTYDEEWQQSRAPYLPADFDPQFFQLAPADLIAEDYLSGGERVDVEGATPGGRLSFRLPIVQLTTSYLVDGNTEQRTPVLDTVILEPDLDRFQLVWRVVLPCDKKALRVSAVRASVSRLQIT